MKTRKRTAAQIAADRFRTGRPPVPEAKRRAVPLTIRTTAAERRTLEAEAKRAGVSLGELLMRPWRGKREG